MAKLRSKILGAVFGRLKSFAVGTAVPVFALNLLAAGNVTAAGDVEAGKTRSVLCASCHGAAGISNGPMWPNLAGQKSDYLVKQLKAFRSGERKDPMMEPMAKPLSDDDIANLAAYYASLK